MPKVKEEYLVNRRNQILDAAFAVCNRKPAYDVTMTDIVSETGMSQGGVYKYFNNIDLVLAALVDRANSQGNYIEQIDEIRESGNSPEVILQDLFLVSERYFSEMLLSYNKILFELSTLFVYSPDRSKRINQHATTSSTFGYLMKCASEAIITGTKKGYFTPVMPVEDILAFIIASFDGIIRDVTLSGCCSGKNMAPSGVAFNGTKLIQCLYRSVIVLLGKRKNDEKR